MVTFTTVNGWEDSDTVNTAAEDVFASVRDNAVGVTATPTTSLSAMEIETAGIVACTRDAQLPLLRYWTHMPAES